MERFDWYKLSDPKCRMSRREQSAIGELARRFNTIGLGNVHIGYRTGYQVSGSYNVTMGMYAESSALLNII